MRRLRFPCVVVFLFASAFAATPVTVTPVTAKNGMVVAAHPEAVEAGVAVLKAGGNAIDAAVATSLAVGVAEPYGSGLGGKLMMVYYDARSGKTFAVDAMDAAGSVDVAAYLKRPEEDRSYGYGSVCVPGLAAGLWTAHQKWGVRKWSDDVAPAIALARKGFTILPKTRDFFEEQEKKLRRGDAEIARLYLPNGKLPETGTRLANEDLAKTMELLAAHGRDGFYRGPVAEAIVAASKKGGGTLTLEDLANYQARIAEPISTEVFGHRLMCAPPPASGAVLFLPILKALEAEKLSGLLRSPENLERIAKVWRLAGPQVTRSVADAPESRALVEKLLAPEAIAELRQKAFGGGEPKKKKMALLDDSPFAENPMASTTHFIVVDGQGNIVCVTQSQSLHFGAGVVPPGTGVVMNDSMSNFAFTDSKALNYIAPGKRPRSTISPTIVFKDGKPVFAIGVPGAARIPTAMLQALLDRLAFGRSLAEAIGDTRIHFSAPLRRDETETFDAEQSLPHATSEALKERGWKVVLPEVAGRGRYFGGINAIELNRDGTLTGYADPRRTNVAAGF